MKLSYFPFDKTKPNAFETFMFGSGGVPQTLDAAIQAKIAGKFEVENKTLEEMEKSEVKAFVVSCSFRCSCCRKPWTDPACMCG